MPNIQNQEENIYETIYKYYPVNIDRYSTEYDVSMEHKSLLERLEIAGRDLRWRKFLKLVQRNNNYDVLDRSIFAFPIPCFKANIYLQSEGQRYELVFYVSIISEYYAFRIDRLFNESELNFDLNTESGKRLAEAIKERYLSHKAKYKPTINEIPKELDELLVPLFQYQEETFGYKLFPRALLNRIVPKVETNTKIAGTASIFDCIFTDFEL